MITIHTLQDILLSSLPDKTALRYIDEIVDHLSRGGRMTDPYVVGTFKVIEEIVNK